ncbi:MAG: hypothetical protein I3274_02595 [Candidatus Moeniiplasma glomeromycotorum]|nr:hypothetical protein [Candidatus Moeniiplasma glomeromycotorum]MCE8167493.1 hypothetical protein [Candidatus Moeniiplasma glomeromycotorum]
MSSKIGLSVQLDDTSANKERIAVLSPGTGAQAGKRVLTITGIANTNVIPFVEEAGANKGNWVTKTAADFFADNAGNKNQAPQTITSIVIVDKDAKGWTVARLQRLIYLKLAIKDNGGDQMGVGGLDPDGTTPATARNDQWVFTLHNLENDPAIRVNAGVMTIDLNAASPVWPGADLKTDFDIDDVNLVENGTGKRVVRWNFAKAQNALLELEDLLKGYYEKYGIRQERFDKVDDTIYVWSWYEPNPPTFPAENVIKEDYQKLWKEYGKYANDGKTYYGVAAVPSDNSQIKSVLYNLENGRAVAGNADKLYSFKIDFWNSYLEMVERYKKAGFQNNHEAIIAFNNGFKTSAEVSAIKSRKYKGFEVLGSKQKVEEGTLKGSVNDTKIKNNCPYIKGAFHSDNNNARTAIDNLRSLAVRTGGDDTNQLVTNFSTKGTTATSDAKDSIFAEENRTTKQQLYGFQPGDVAANKQYNSAVFGHTYAYDLRSEDLWKTFLGELLTTTPTPVPIQWMTKVMFDLTTVGQNGTWQEVVQVAFAGRSNTGANDVLHTLDEFAGHANTLTKYYQFIQNGQEVHNGTMRYAHKGRTYNGIPPDDDTDKFAKQIDACHAEAQKWAKIWDTAYSYSNKSQASTDKPTVEAFKNATTEPTAGSTDYAAWMRYWINQNATWKAAIDKKLTEINTAISSSPPTPGKDTLDDLIKNSSGTIKEIWEVAISKGGYTGTDKPTKELKDLVDWIKAADENTAGETELKGLREYSEITDAGDEKKKAWEIANEVKGKITAGSTDGAAAEALKKLEDELQVAKDAAKKAMENESGAYDAIGIDSLEDKKKIEKITEIWNKAKVAWNETTFKDNDTDNKINELENFKKDNQTEWDAVNKYTSKSSEGYATGALKHLQDFKKKKDAKADEIKNSANGNEAMKKYNEADDKAGLTLEDAKRLAGYAELKNSSEQTEQKLAKLLAEKNSATDFAETDEELKKINEVIQDLEAYVNDAGKDTDKGKALKKLETNITGYGDAKAVLNNWITKLKERKTYLEQKQQERRKNDNGNKENSGFDWTSPPMLFVYGIGAIGILGGLAWLAFKGGSEDESEE